jgi:hypothetical protein
VKAHHGELNGCYDALLARNAGKQPLPQGTVTMQFTVEEDGKVSAAAIAPGGLDDPTLSKCLAEKIRAWVFSSPRAGGPVKVAYPLKLRPPE